MNNDKTYGHKGTMCILGLNGMGPYKYAYQLCMRDIHTKVHTRNVSQLNRPKLNLKFDVVNPYSVSRNMHLMVTGKMVSTVEVERRKVLRSTLVLNLL